MKRIFTLFLSLIIVVLFSISVFADSTSTIVTINDTTSNIKMVVGEHFDIPHAELYQIRLQLNGVVTFNGRRVNAIKKGTALIQCTDKSDYRKTTTYAITVDEPVINNVILKQGEEFTFVAETENIWTMDNDNIISFECLENGLGIIKALDKGETTLTGTSKRNGKRVYKFKVIDSDDTMVTPTAYTEPQETIPAFTVEYVSTADGGKYLPYMIIGEYITVDNPDFYNWTIESDGAITFDGEKITAVQKGKGKVIGIGKDDLQYTKTYDLTVGDPVVVKKTLKIGTSKNVVGNQLLKMFDYWKVENENIAFYDGHYINALSEGTTYLTGTNDGGGKYTFEITVVSEDTPITESTNQTEPKDTEPVSTEPGESVPDSNVPDATEPVSTEPSESEPDSNAPDVTEPSETPHSHVTKTINKSSATYFSKGYTGDDVCADCGKIIRKGKTIPVLKLKIPKATIKGGKKKITVKYNKVKDATGFQVKYKIGNKSVTLTYNTKKTITKTIKDLKKGTYKVYVRAFVKQGKNKAYSSWSAVKKVKVK